MVGIVIVSHSASLAEGVRELADQMVQGKVPLAVAGGIDDPDHPIGTDAQKVYEAIKAVYSEDGVVVLMDLGSALLSAEMALEFLVPEERENVYLSESPLVEGALAAVVQASAGSSAEQVLTEARGALAAKISQLRPLSGAEPLEQETVEPADGALELILRVKNPLGLHARPAARFVTTASRFQAEVIVYKGTHSANAKSINQVATLGVGQGDEITIRASGVDAAAALQAIQSLAAENFGDTGQEMPAAPQPLPAAASAISQGRIDGIAASPGIAIGPVLHYGWQPAEVVVREINDPEDEWRRLQDAIQQARADIDNLHAIAANQAGAAEAAIFEAHLLFLTDPALVNESRARIYDRHVNAEAAWWEVVEEIAGEYRGLKDAYMQARSADILDVGNRVLQHLMALERPAIDIDKPSILAAADLTPSDTAKLDPGRILGICTGLGGATSHSAILARALGIPAVVGLGPAIESLKQDQIVIIDGTQGHLIIDPNERDRQLYQEKRAAWIEARETERAASHRAAITRDGRRLEIAANIGNPRDAADALASGAEGIGLFRTEFLFLDRQALPNEEEQFQAYNEVAQLMGSRPLIIRTLDVGGDKPLPYLEMARSDNPFLGKRGVRFYLEQPDVYIPQLRAILRASFSHNVKLMFPMISTLAELKQAKALVSEIGQELLAAGVPIDEQLEVGIMIEVPAAVAVADQLAQEADFFSIGTNDLTQYVMAADRGNSQVAGLANALQPAVLRLIHQTTKAAKDAGIWVGLCGELAGNPMAAPLLVGLELHELSMNGQSIPAVKEAIRHLTFEEAREIAAQAMALESAADVEKLLNSR